MRTVTILGGPKDGEQLTIEDDTATTVCVYTLAPVTAYEVAYDTPDPSAPAATIHYCQLRKRQYDGRWFALWPKGDS